MPMITIGWLLYFYTGRYDADGNKIMIVSYTAFAVINLICRVFDALAAPFVGYLSDKINTRWGRRMPWIIIGAPFMTVFAVMLFYPPGVPGSAVNVIWLTMGLSGLWFFYTVAVAPYIALLPEITVHDEERIEISTYMGVFEVAGTLLATIAVGFFIQEFPHGIGGGTGPVRDGYKLAIIIFGFLSLVFFWISIAFVQEKPPSRAKEVPYGFIESMKQCMKNRAFIYFMVTVTFFSAAIDTLIAMIPFMVTLVMKEGPHMAGYIQGGLVVLTLPVIFIIYRVAAKVGKKRVFGSGLVMFACTLPFIALMKVFPFAGLAVNRIGILMGYRPMSMEIISLIHVCIFLVFLVFPLAAFFVLIRPIFADIIDIDEEMTGFRREAMYDGMQGLVIKVAAGIASIIGPLSLMFFGGTIENPGGVQVVLLICAVFLLAAYYVFKKYPLEK